MNLATQVALLTARRTDFVGRTNKYDSVSMSRGGGASIGDALSGVGPFDVSKQLFDDRQREMAINRLSRYRNNWKYYRGQHHDFPMQDGEIKPVHNFCRPVVDKATEFYVARGWKIQMPQGNELVADVINACLSYNHHVALTHMLKQFSSVTGDGFLYVTVKTTDDDGKPLPKKEWKVVMTVLNPSYCFPTFDVHGNIERILIQYPTNSNVMNSELFSMIITRKSFQLFKNDTPLTAEMPNKFGMVNVIHFKNLPLAYSNFGTSDIDDVVPLNDSYNRTAFSIERIIRYHAEPTTIIQGAKASTLEKGANKVWSGIPTDGKVYNLEMMGNIDALTKYLEILEKRICDVSSTPKVVLDGSELPHSNTPGVTMEFMYKPLLDKTNRSWETQIPSWKKVVKLIMIGHEKIIGENLTELADFPDKLEQYTVERTSNMPRDHKYEFELAKLKMEAGILSRAEVIRRFSDGADSERLALELAADKVAEFAEAAEIAKAEQGIPPNLSAAFLASPFLTEDMQDLSKQIAKLDTNVNYTAPVA